MLLRTVTALVGLAILFACLWGGLPGVFLIILLAAILGIREFYRLHPPDSSLPAPDNSLPAPETDTSLPTPEVAVPETNVLELVDDSATDEDLSQTTAQPTLITGDPSQITARGEPVEPHLHNSAPDTREPEQPVMPSQSACDKTTVALASPASLDDEGGEGREGGNYTPEEQPINPAPSLPAATSLPNLVGAVWVAAFVIGGAAANGLLHFWGISLGVFLAGGFVALLWFIAFYHGPRWPVAAVYLYGGPVYVGFLLAHVLVLAQVGENFFYANPTAFDFLSFPDDSYSLGRNWVLFALLTTFATDTGAYLVGRAIGRHPMAPGISPNKTWEGAAGGFFGAIIAALLLERLLNLGLGTEGWTVGWSGVWAQTWNWQPLLIGATVGIVAQLGDLLESKLKRLSQVKDAGGLMPGHGGLLDRLDSLLITIPVVYYLLVAVLRP